MTPKAARNAAIAKAYDKGKFFRSIAAGHGLSRYTIRNIVYSARDARKPRPVVLSEA